jgi:hypothetical protein
VKTSIALWTLTVGLAGFLAGFVGPMLVMPDANQGPLVGIFFSGPLGLILGAVLGTGMRLFGVHPAVSGLWLAVTCVAVIVATLYILTPEPRLETTLVDLEVRGCVPALDWKDRAFAEWDKKLTLPGWSRPVPDWRGHFERTAIGSVVTASTRRHRQIWIGQAAWNRDKRWASAWEAGGTSEPSNKEFYSSKSCADSPVGSNGVFVAKPLRPDGRYPPLDPPGFLGMADLVEVPRSEAALTR